MKEFFIIFILLCVFKIIISEFDRSSRKKYYKKQKELNEDFKKKEKLAFERKNKFKGEEYEKQIAQILKQHKYKIEQRGIEKNKLDGGIDIIAYSKKEILLIQCKNWQNTQIKQQILKEFLGNCYTYIEKNLKNEKRKIRKIFITSNEKIDYGVQKYIEENKEILEYRIIKYKEV